ncbi:MAG TPA: hypothetical protein VFA18_22940 [Gemmataceae bacterium]|nr:hypothetical protein [Gemmataceae bacterium]
MTDRVVGQRSFRDGQCRTVYADGNGFQYLLDSQGRRVYGVWLLPDDAGADEPHIVEAFNRPAR